MLQNNLGEAAPALLHDVRQLIEQARAHVASAANSAQTLLYWRVGQKIAKNLLTQGRAAYGKEILPLKQPLEREFYAEMCRIERWGVRTLREGGQLARERQARQTGDLTGSI